MKIVRFPIPYSMYADSVFSMRVLVFLASGILEDGSVAFFHMNSYVFLELNCFF